MTDPANLAEAEGSADYYAERPPADRPTLAEAMRDEAEAAGWR